MTIWSPDITGKPGPKYRIIADEIGGAIADGRLDRGARLPPQRDLAYQLGVSLNTVTRGYGEALRRGLVQGEIGRGTYVRTGDQRSYETIPSAHLVRRETGPIDFRLNLPSVGRSAEMLSQTLAELSHSPTLASFLDYQPDGDLDAHAHAEAGATWINRLGMDVSGRNVVLATGAQHGVMASLMATTRPGDTLFTEQMTYAPLKQMAHHLSLKLCPVELDEQGLKPDKLDAACRKTGATTLYCLPTLHTPTTVTMPEERRRAIADVARQHGLTIIEDDVFGFLPRYRPPPLAVFAPERTVFITSVSKSLAPGLRIGYLHMPETYRRAIRGAIAMSCWMPPPLMAEIASRWIFDGTADRLNNWQRDEILARQQIARHILAGYPFKGDPNGLNLWLPLPAPWRADGFRSAAEARGVKLLTAEAFAVGQAPVPHAVRLCLGYEISRHRMTAGMDTIAELLERTDSPDTLPI